MALAVALTGVPVSTYAQDACALDSEPNDSEAQAAPMTGPCVSGALPDGDQDLYIWEAPPEAASTRWDITLEGIPGVLTILQFFVVTSEPGAALMTVSSTPLIEVHMSPDEAGPVTRDGVLLPVGRYLMGVARSDRPDGGAPATLDYRVRVEAEPMPPPNADTEPNDEIASAAVVTGAFEVSGDRQGSKSDYFAWDVGQPGHWDVAIATPVGESAWFELQDDAGTAIDNATATTEARLYDLALDPGRYRIRVPETGDEPHPYVLLATPSTIEGDPEPDDDTTLAVRLTDGQPQPGRLAKEGDRDRYTLAVPAGQPVLRDVRMRWRTASDRRLCLLDATDQPEVCRSGSEGLVLQNLVLAPGDHTFEVSGVTDATDAYLLRVDVTGPAAPDFEAEPNDEVATATIIDPSLGMTARGGPGDDDVFGLTVDGDAGLWQVDVAGSGIQRAELIRANGLQIAAGDIAPDGSTATLADLYLVPGQHWVRISSNGPEYHVTTTSIGPPDPDAEREPNDNSQTAEPYRIGARRVGRLPTSSDRDLYRFTLAAPQHLRFDLAQPAAAATAIRVSRDGDLLNELAGRPPGETISIDLWLEAGDHIIELVPEQTSDEPYELTSAILDSVCGHRRPGAQR